MTHTNNGKRQRTRPITLFVEKVERADLDHIQTERVTIVDVEMSQVVAKQLILLLREREQGTLRFRFAGRLILS